MSSAALSKAEVKQLVEDWYRILDVHAPAEEVLPLLSDEDLLMQFPEGALKSHAEFQKWYAANSAGSKGVIYIFFDEVHELRKLDITCKDDQAEVDLVVRWEARRWNAPSPKSELLRFDAAQRWTVKRSERTNKLVITRYFVDSLQPLEGSVPL